MELKPIIVAVEELFFRSKIAETAHWLQTKPIFVKKYQQLLNYTKKENPKLIIVDLNYDKFNPIESVQKLRKSIDTSSTLVIGFLSHRQLGLREEAMAKGFDYVFPKSLFVQKLAELIQEATQERAI